MNILTGKRSNGMPRSWDCEVCGRVIRAHAQTIHLVVLSHIRAERRKGLRKGNAPRNKRVYFVRGHHDRDDAITSDNILEVLTKKSHADRINNRDLGAAPYKGDWVLVRAPDRQTILQRGIKQNAAGRWLLGSK